jgi:hypothetical protein
VSQRRSGPYGLFSRAEDKVKLSNDVIEEGFTRSATVVEFYFTRSAILWAFCWIELQTQSAFHRLAQRNVFRRRDVHL